MNPFKRFLAVVLLGITALSFGTGASAWMRENGSRVLVCGALATACALGLIDPASALVGGMILMAGNAPYPIQPELTAIALAYSNRSMIADEVLPRLAVGKQEFKYLKHDVAEGFTIPDTKVGRRSSPGQVEFSATELADFTQDYGLDDVIPQNDLDNAPPNYDPLGKSTAFLTNLILLDREVRVANVVFANATYPAANRVTLSGTSQWSDYTNSDPIAAIMNALDGTLIRPNVAIFGRATFSKLRMHPKVVQAVNSTNQGAGVVSRQQIADLLELEEVVVGEGFVNTAKKGQTAAYARAWGKHASFLFRDRTALVGKGVTFGFTAQFGGRTAASWSVKENAGLKGGIKVRTGESVKEVISANDLGYFFENAVA